MSFGLPFIQKNKRPRVAKPEESRLPEEKIINGSASDDLEAHCFRELMEATKNKDPFQFRQAIFALVAHTIQPEESHESGHVPSAI